MCFLLSAALVYPAALTPRYTVTGVGVKDELPVREHG